MFTLAFERRHKVLLAHFGGMFETRDIEKLDDAVRRIVAEQGPVRGLLDFSDVALFAVPDTMLAARSRLPQISPGQRRVIVAPHDGAFEQARAYAQAQRNHGNVDIDVVRSLAEAHAALGLVDPVFEPID